MGTTSTPNLGLIKPDQAEDMTNWPSQFDQNADTLDKIFRFGNPIDFTPEFRGSVSDPSLGTGGYVQGKLIRLWPWVCIIKIRMFAGTSGFNAGSGGWRFFIPEDIMARMASGLPSGWPSGTTGNSCFGSAMLHDTSNASNSQTARVAASTLSSQLFFYLATEGTAAGTSVTDAVPFAWASNDKLSLQAMYVLGGT